MQHQPALSGTHRGLLRRRSTSRSNGTPPAQSGLAGPGRPAPWITDRARPHGPGRKKRARRPPAEHRRAEQVDEGGEVGGDHRGAAGHGLQDHEPKLSRARCGATKTSAEPSRSTSPPRRPGRGRHTGRAGSAAPPGDHHLQPRHGLADCRQRGQQHVQTLAGLVGPAEEDQPTSAGTGASRGVRAKSANRKPLGMTTASRPRCWTTTNRAVSDTAIEACSFSVTGRNTPPARDIDLDLGVAVWKVATTGCSAAHSASSATLGRDGFVDVHQVETVTAKPAPNPRRAERSEADPGDRTVVSQRHRRAGVAETAGPARAARRPAARPGPGRTARGPVRPGAGRGRGRGSGRRPGPPESTGRPGQL